MEASDQDLVARVQSGDHHAYRYLVERYSRGVFRLAYRMTGSEQDAEDIVQESFLKAFRQMHRFESRSGFGTWLYRITANCALDFLRLRQRHAEATGEMPGLTSAEPAPDRLTYSSELRLGIADALGTLSPQERAAFVLRHYQGCGIQEIAGSLNLSETAAKNTVFRPVQKLRRHLEPLCATMTRTN
ncbi:MAG: RNA polymerase sigma factor [Acidobacteriia bacterium]|nr:RNA polymerase sigma factor [Terriglobia bacterium]